MDGRPCIGKPLAETAVVEGVPYYRVPYGPPPVIDAARSRELWADWPEDWPANCHDCRTPQGGLHHPGCDAERCPRCLHQAISCGCRWIGDKEEDPDDPDELDPRRYLNDEVPQARRAMEAS